MLENQFEMTVTLEIYGPMNQNLRLTEKTQLSRSLTIEQAAKVLQRFSDLAKAVQLEQSPQANSQAKNR